MSVRFHIAHVLRRYSGGEAEVELEGSNVEEVLNALFQRFPSLRIRVVKDDGTLHPYLILFHNEETLPHGAFAAVAVHSGDELDLVGAVEGGAPDPEPLPVATSSADVRMRGFRVRVPLEAALAEAQRGLQPLPAVERALAGVAGRVLAADVRSEVSVPPFRRAAMDGYAVQAADTFGATLYDPVRLRLEGEILPGTEAAHPLTAGTACRIMTGARVPEGADAVLMAEHAAEEAGPEGASVLVQAAVPPQKNVGRIGEDIEVGQIVLHAGRRLRPQDVGLLASIGHSPVPVVRQPRVHIVVTGNELLPPGSRPEGTRIVDSNTPMLEALVARDGGVVEQTHRLGDDPEAIEAALRSPGADVIICAGGSSVGREDFLPVLCRQIGELPIHGVAMRPSAPTGIGRLGGARLFLLPGNPVSCLAAYDTFAGPVVRALGGLPLRPPYQTRKLPLARKLVSQIGRLDYARVALTKDGRVEPLAISGASILSSTTRAAGYVVVPTDSEGLPEGSEVDVFFYDAWTDGF
jgi:molybdopterin molybdotransferase